MLHSLYIYYFQTRFVFHVRLLVKAQCVCDVSMKGVSSLLTYCLCQPVYDESFYCTKFNKVKT